MPHVIVKMYAGRAETQKRTLADEITRAVSKSLGYGNDAVSVSIEDVAPKDWVEKVYKPEIVDKPGQLYKKSSYFPAQK